MTDLQNQYTNNKDMLYFYRKSNYSFNFDDVSHENSFLGGFPSCFGFQLDVTIVKLSFPSGFPPKASCYYGT